MYARCGPALNTIPDATGRRVSFIHASKVYGMKFFKEEARACGTAPRGHFASRLTRLCCGAQGYAWFTAKLDDCCFANRTGKEATEENRAKEFGEYATWALGVDGEAVAGDAEMWELDEPAPPKASKFRQSMGTPKPKVGEEATELQIGALRNCYLVRGGGVDVYKNTEDGLEDEGVTLKLRDVGGDAFTPQKALLARGERNLLLLTPTTTPGGRTHSVFQFDIERETVVSGWKCQKGPCPRYYDFHIHADACLSFRFAQTAWTSRWPTSAPTLRRRS